MTYLIIAVAVAADRQAWKPIKFADEVPTRTARKWGRHAH